MIYHSFFNIQEGLYVPEDIRKLFELDFRDLNNRGESIFTGLVVKNNKVLISWPKHYWKREELEGVKLDDSRLLFYILFKYMDRVEESYFKNNLYETLKDMFPMGAFRGVLKYYNKYGLYQEDNLVEKQGYSGKINWKKTISRSNKVISNNQLLFIPFFIRDRHSEDVFLSECMAYVINETYAMLSFAFPNKLCIELKYNKELFSSKEYILNKLRSLKGKIFKDINKELLKNLIDYFESIGNPDDLKYKNHHFNIIWETMIEEYLNRNLKKINKNSMEFEQDINLYNFQKKSFDVAGWRIEIDHYHEDDEYIYILDSKYYKSLKDLNYKQIAYDYFLRSKNKKTINALIVSSNETETLTHIDYMDYSNQNLFIAIHNLSIKEVMRDCAK